MSVQTEKFFLGDIEWNQAASRELSSSPPSIVRTGLRAVLAVCKTCQHSWRATEHGAGRFRPGLGSVNIECPSCKTSENVSTGALG